MKPINQPAEWRVDSGGVRLSVFEWPGQDPPLLFAHANSFHARIWDRVIAAFPGRRCLAPDLRGHGRSDRPPSPYRWRLFAQDLVHVARHFGLTGALGVGHSLGGHSCALAAALAPECFGALLLIDPVILMPDQYTGRLPGEHFAARRRSQFESPEAMIERFRDRLPFSRWDPAVLRDYCVYGLLPSEGGGFELACPPAIEAEIYQNGADLESNIYPEIAAIECPVRVLRAGNRQVNPAQDFSGSPTAPELARAFRHGEDVALPEYSHFIPMEAPDLIAEHIRALLNR